MNALSLFNGMSFGMMALESLGLKVDSYYSSEIDKYANQATKALYPEIIQIGDVTKWRKWCLDLGSIDLLLAGFPCQAWSPAGKQDGDDDPRGALVHDLIDIWQEINKQRLAQGKKPVKFMFENVKMKKQFLDYINNLFGVEPILINSALVSAQDRKRYYWNNTGCTEQPEDMHIYLNDIFEGGKHKENSDGWHVWWEKNQKNQIKKSYSAICNDGSRDKAITLTARQYASWNGNFVHVSSPCKFVGFQRVDSFKYRNLTVRENARLQSVPENHIDTLLSSGVSNKQLYKMLGNGWNMLTVKHVLSGLTSSFN